MNPEYLSTIELVALTNSVRPRTQASWLLTQRIPNKLDGRRVIVSREHVRSWLEGQTVVSSSGPNWAAVS